MITRHNELVELLKDMKSVEMLIGSRTANIDTARDALEALDERLDRAQKQVDSANDTTEEKAVAALIACSQDCVKQSLKIVDKLSKNIESGSNYSYASYRFEVSKLRKLVRKRRELASAIDEELFTGTEKLIVDNLDKEDAVLISILLAMTVIDGVVHKNEKKVIKKRYKEITLFLPDEAVLDACLSRADDTVGSITERLRTESVDIHPDVKKRMFLAALDVAIADRHLHENEIVLLLDVKDALQLSEDAVGKITEPEDIVNLVKRRRRVRKG